MPMNATEPVSVDVPRARTASTTNDSFPAYFPDTPVSSVCASKPIYPDAEGMTRQQIMREFGHRLSLAQRQGSFGGGGAFFGDASQVMKKNGTSTTARIPAINARTLNESSDTNADAIANAITISSFQNLRDLSTSSSI